MFESVEEFYRPSSTREVLDLMKEYRGEVWVVAGGTEMVAGTGVKPRVVVDLSRTGLNSIRQRHDNWVIGGATTLAEIERSASMQEMARGIVPRAAAMCGPGELRNRMSIGCDMSMGNPGADVATALLVLNATVTLGGAKGMRRMSMDKYLNQYRWMRKQLLIEVAVPTPRRSRLSGWSFQKLGRSSTDISIVSLALAIQMNPKGVVTQARVALGGTTQYGFRVGYVERLLEDYELTRKRLSMAAHNTGRCARAVGDRRAGKEYRQEMTEVLMQRALDDCVAQMESLRCE